MNDETEEELRDEKRSDILHWIAFIIVTGLIIWRIIYWATRFM